MQNEVLIALLSKMVEEKFQELPLTPISHRGPRGRPGSEGRGFDFNLYEPTIKEWCKKFAIKFEDLSEDEIEKLRGPVGHNGADGNSFNFQYHEQSIRELCKEFSLKFSDLTSEEIGALRGPKGEAGRDGRDGAGFVWEESRERVLEIVRETVEGMSEELRLKFSDLSETDIQKLRGPRGRDGHDGRDFIFEEHVEYFNSLKPKFSDFTEEEKESLKLKFSQLTDEEKNNLRLKFEDLSDDQKISLRGPRGLRGQKGITGREGPQGKQGLSIRGLPGLKGLIGMPGVNGRDGQDGQDGKDAPYITDIEVDSGKDSFAFIFSFSNGNEIRTEEVELPKVESKGIIGGGSYTVINNISGESSGNIILLNVPCDASVIITDAVRMSSGLAVKAQADSVANANLIGIVQAKSSPTLCDIRVTGVSPTIFSGLDETKEYFLSAVTAGTIVDTPDSAGAGQVVLRVGQPFGLDQFLVNKGIMIILS